MNENLKASLSLRGIGDGIFQSDQDIVKFSMQEVDFVKDAAKRCSRRRARICAHQSNENSLHEMMIAICSDSYIHPHRHIGKSESFHIIEGKVDVVVLNDDGGIMEIVKLGDQSTGRNFYYRLSNAHYHTLLIHSDMLVVHEVTNGPFSREQTELAPFAPPEEEPVMAMKYIEKLKKQACEYR